MRTFSGIQPTGAKHLGNWLGAIRNYVAMQDDGGIYCVVDLHSLSLTAYPEPDALRRQTLDTARLLLAGGLDPERCVVFVQSHNPDHAALGWICTCVTSYGELHRMTQFKDKGRGQEHVPAGLLTYPALMAADILAYDSDRVPVGEDQRQHLELARDVAGRLNSRYGPGTARAPEGVFTTVAARVMDLADPTRKMSTTGGTPAGTILVLDAPDVIAKKCRSATTDSGREIVAGPDKAGVTNLLEIYAACAGGTVADAEARFAGEGYGAFKAAVAEAVVEELRPVREAYEALTEGDVRAVLAAGAARARELSGPIVARIAAATGLLAP